MLSESVGHYNVHASLVSEKMLRIPAPVYVMSIIRTEMWSSALRISTKIRFVKRGSSLVLAH